ncbi:UvrD/REP helicase [Leptolyngbya sp. NIES-3755]|nr:UvrD/REP helicase [Leptolyngbya sp. NIES-3755]
MSTPWLTTMKPTFQTEWLALPPKESHQILEKISLLAQDPTPDAKVKKQLKYMGGKLHRLRSGNYRIFYTFEHPYISLLALRRREDDTYDEEHDAEFLGGLDPELKPQSNQPNWEKLFSQAPVQETALPEPMTIDLLTNLRIPEVCHARLLRVDSREKLFDCPGIPDEIILKLDEYLFERPLVEVLQQPDFLAGDVDNLLKFKEGDLVGFLLKLNSEQEKFVTWAVNASGPTLLKGSPGTGKSTVALYRTREILHQLQAKGIHQPRILFTTYTNALVTFSEQLLQQLLGEDAQLIEVKTADALMYSIVNQATGKPAIAPSNQLLKLIRQAVPTTIATLEGNVLQQQAQRLILQRLQPEYLLEELTEVIDARGIDTLEDYQAISRTGRDIPLNKTQRQAIWNLRQQFNLLLRAQGFETWAQMRIRALEMLQSAQLSYDAVIIDEAQDLSPIVLRFLVQLCKAPNRLFITADANQSIYGSSFRWVDVHASLKFVGRTGVLKINHRTTKEIGEAAYSYLREGLIDSEETEREYVHTGPPPAVRAIVDRASEGELLARFCRTAAHEFRLGLGACAILVPTEKAGKDIAGQLNYLGIEARSMTSKDLNLNCKGVKILPLKAAKGLEFPIVAIAGFLEQAYPTIAKGTLPEAAAEILMRERRTLYVAMTRAMRGLLVLVPDTKPSLLLQSFDAQLWNLGNS